MKEERESKYKSPFMIFISVAIAGLLLMSLYMYVTGQNSTGDIFSVFKGVAGQQTINYSTPLFVALFLAILLFIPERIAEKFNSNLLI